MEDTLQKVFSILISVIIFFLLPLYMAFEKKDDIAYSLALKISSNFVDEVCNKGYMTLDMYNDFISDLAVTGNAYDVSMEHVSRVYKPVIYAYDSAGKQYKFDYQLYANSYNGVNKELIIGTDTYENATLSYKVNEIRYYDRQMLEIMEQDVISRSVLNQVEYSYNTGSGRYEYLNGGNLKLDTYKNTSIGSIPPVSGLYRTSSGKSVYPMNAGDKFTIVVKNTNTSIASVLFNTLTFGAKTGADTKVYINYGGDIENEEYRQTIIDSNVTNKSEDYIISDGDINNDGVVDDIDMELLNDYLLDGDFEDSYTEEKLNNIKQKLDVNNDGDINNDDKTALEELIDKAKNEVLIQSIEINHEGRIEMGNTENLDVSISPSNATNKKLMYKTSNPAIATVDEHGNITAHSNGTVNITVSSQDGSNVSTTFNLKVVTFVYNSGALGISGGIKYGGYYAPLGGGSHEHKIIYGSSGVTIQNKENGYRNYIITGNSINLNEYNKVCAKVVVNNSSYATTENTSTWLSISSVDYHDNIEVNTDKMIKGTQYKGISGEKILEVDVSDITTKGYIAVSFAHKGNMILKSLWLEK